MFVAYPTTPPGLPDRLGLVLGDLRRVLAHHAVKNRALAAIVVVLCNRLSRTLERITALVARHQAGTLRKPPKPHTRRTASRPPSPPRDPLPRRRGWLIGYVQECVAYGNHLQLLVEDPDTRALIEAIPQLRRHFRPLWRMLRYEPMPEMLKTPRPASPRRRPRASTRRVDAARRSSEPARRSAKTPRPSPGPAPASHRARAGP